jgi:hypothetical protein
VVLVIFLFLYGVVCGGFAVAEFEAAGLAVVFGVGFCCGGVLGSGGLLGAVSGIVVDGFG